MLINEMLKEVPQSLDKPDEIFIQRNTFVEVNRNAIFINIDINLETERQNYCQLFTF
jgi:hypothetical protein